MTTIKFDRLFIELPDKVGYPSEKEIREWLDYEMGCSPSISAGNPLAVIELKDCDVDFSIPELNFPYNDEFCACNESNRHPDPRKRSMVCLNCGGVIPLNKRV